jgi:xanthine/uracil/vitamin C permease (AzgA family)
MAESTEKSGKKTSTGNLLLFAGLIIFMTMFTIVSVMGNIASQSIDKTAGAVFIASALMIIVGLFF